jgi:hypothetical protein
MSPGEMSGGLVPIHRQRTGCRDGARLLRGKVLLGSSGAGFIVMLAGKTGWLRSLARAGRFVPPAAAAGWRIRQRISWIAFFQWFQSGNGCFRCRLAYDSGLVRDVLHIFIQTIFSSLRRRARQYWGIVKSKCGAVTFAQRFGGAINLKKRS